MPDVNVTYQEMAAHYGVAVVCPASTISSGRRQLILLINDNYS
jgi:hypothetical protein